MKFACRGEISAPPIRWPFRPHCLEHPARAELVLRVLEDAAERALVRRLGRLPLRLQVGDRRLDLRRGPRRQPELDRARRPGRERAPSGGSEARARRRRASARPSRRRRARARGSPSSRSRKRRRSSARRRPPCRGSRTRTRSRRARRRGRGGGRRRSPRRRRRRAASPSTSTRGELAFEPDDERVDALVGGEQVRAEPDRRDRAALAPRPRRAPPRARRPSSGRASARAGPPIPTVVSRASGTPSSIAHAQRLEDRAAPRGRRRRRRR